MSLRLHRSSRGLAPATLRAGSDLVLEVAPEHGLALEDGVAVEDHLDHTARVAADSEAIAALATWRAHRGDALIVGGIDLGHVAEVELLAGCFLPGTLIRHGLLATGAHERVEALGFDGPALTAIAGLVPEGCEVTGTAAPAPPPPGRGGRRDALVSAVERARVPAWTRGDVVCVPYWHLIGVYTALARDRRRPRPVPAGLGLAGLGGLDVARTLLRGGWGGSSGARARALSAERVARLASQLLRSPAGDTAIARSFDGWALAVMARDAGAAPAQLEHFGRVVRNTRLIVTPFDSPAEQRVLLTAGRREGVPSLVVQHGYKAGLNDPDMTLSDHVAVWSEHDRDDLTPRAAGQVTVTGNPGADATAAAPSHGGGRSVVLVEYPGRLSATIGHRTGLQHVATAVRALALARPGDEIVIRPHPADDRSGRYVAALGEVAMGARLTLDAHTPIEQLLASAGLCVGALSTASLQAAVAGVQTIFLDVSGTHRPWPFDGTPDAFPVARSAEELVAAIADPPRGRIAAGEALGLTGDATAQVLNMIDALAGR